MEGAEQSREKISNSMRINGLSIDLLNRYMNHNRNPNINVQEKGKFAQDENEELQLSLGLSMNGRFGVDPERKMLKRSSSISNLALAAAAVDDGSTPQARGVNAPLSRTCSLPAEPEEEWRRRKETQSIKRMRRMEKLKTVRGGGKEKENCSEDVSINGDVSGSFTSEKVDSGSIGSQKTGSSGVSVLQSQQRDGEKQNGEVKSPYTCSLPIVQVEDENGTAVTIQATPEDPNKVNELLNSALLDMPYVSAMVNHAKVEGFLYKYKRGEQIKIVCVCHGLFLTPAGFLKHGGGGDVENPLQHIMVSPYPLM
ncbi:hypothetical protein RD792_016803 [Penstemon davidsonii]|uniref:Ninja-family protein n=1 Tax=Penstemon davidsonii TaxID=160366 RepID=A0ABR0CKD4_9LAMI|nr:hypothetical protein RD792_016803 [Penstemon davidsonii]